MGNIWTSESFIFRSTTSGVEVYTVSGTELGFIEHTDEVTSVWSSDDKLYMSTVNAGVLETPLSSISGSVFNNVSTYKVSPNITGDNVRYLHGSGNLITIVTTAGVDHINISLDSRTYETTSDATKCFQAAGGRFYYIEGDTLKAAYETSFSGFTYTAGDGIIPENVTLNDVYVTNCTSTYSNEDNVLFLATTSGAVIIEERRGDESSSRFKYFYIE